TFSPSSATVRSSSFLAGGSPDAAGVYVAGTLTLEDVRAVGTSTGGGSIGGMGIQADTATLAVLGSYAQGSGMGSCLGLHGSQSAVTANGSVFNATGSPGTGVFDSSGMGGPYTLKIDGSTLQGATNSLHTQGTVTTNVFVGGSHFN